MEVAQKQLRGLYGCSLNEERMVGYCRHYRKKVYSRVYGEGVIIDEEDGIITIDFLNKNKKRYLFSGNGGFLWQYIIKAI